MGGGGGGGDGGVRVRKGGKTGLRQYVCINSLALSFKCSAGTAFACTQGMSRCTCSDVCECGVVVVVCVCVCVS